VHPPTDARRWRRPGRATRRRPGVASRPGRWARRRLQFRRRLPDEALLQRDIEAPGGWAQRLAAGEVGEAPPGSSAGGPLRRRGGATIGD
jgi:hypothetical protein